MVRFRFSPSRLKIRQHSVFGYFKDTIPLKPEIYITLTVFSHWGLTFSCVHDILSVVSRGVSGAKAPALVLVD